MKRLLLSTLILILLIGLVGCNNEKAIPLENPELELFSVLYENDDYSILKRTVITDQVYIMIAYYVGHGDNTCILGQYHKVNYLLLYNEEYYDIIEANKLDVYTCSDLINIGVIEN